MGADRPGDQVGLLDQGLIFNLQAAADGVLLVGDESAMAAIAGILRSLPGTARGLALIEVPTADDAQVMRAPAGIGLRWLPRHDRRAVPGQLALDMVRRLLPGDHHPYVYGVGESDMASALSTLLRQELGWPKDRVTTLAYWKHGTDSYA